MKNILSLAASLFLLVAAPAFADPVPVTPGTPAPAGSYSFDFSGSLYDGSGIITTDATGHITAITGNVTDLSDSAISAITGTSLYANADNALYVTPAYVTFMGISFSTATLGDFNIFNTLQGSYGSLNSNTNPGGYYPGVSDVPVTVNLGAVPEPAAWAMMLLGFLAIGAVMRRSSGTPAHVLGQLA